MKPCLPPYDLSPWPLYYLDVCVSTMDESRALAAEGAVAGTLVVADRQTLGRGRGQARRWEAEAGEALLCTLLLRYPSLARMPKALTLRLGLAVRRAILSMLPELAGRLLVKWPNDVMLDGRKCCGILCEGSDGRVHAGIGLNLLQASFPPPLADTATSVLLATGRKLERWELLRALLRECAPFIEGAAEALEGGAAVDGAEAGTMDGAEDARATPEDWKAELESCLYRRGERVRFAPGAADSGQYISGTLEGVDEEGRLLIREDGADAARAFISGECLFISLP